MLWVAVGLVDNHPEPVDGWASCRNVLTDDFVVWFRRRQTRMFRQPRFFPGISQHPFRVMGFAPVEVMFSVGEFATLPW